VLPVSDGGCADGSSATERARLLLVSVRPETGAIAGRENVGLRKPARHFLWAGLARCLRPFGELTRARLYEKDLTSPLTAFSAEAVTITQATASDIEQVAELATSNGTSDVAALRSLFLDRIQRGARCFVAKIDDQVVHCNWLIFDRLESWPSGQGPRVLRDGEAYCTDAYTVPAWRGRAIHTAVLYRMLFFLQEAGYRRAYTIVATANEASWKTHLRLRWRLSGISISFKPHNRDKMLVWTMVWGPRVRAGSAASFIGSESQSSSPRAASPGEGVEQSTRR